MFLETIAKIFNIFIFNKKYLISSRNSTPSFDERGLLWIRLWFMGGGYCGGGYWFSVRVTAESVLSAYLLWTGVATATHGVFGANSGFRVGWRRGRGIYYLLSKGFSGIWFWRGDWAPGYHSMGFRHFPDISQFPRILILKAFGNLWGNSYIPCS